MTRSQHQPGLARLSDEIAAMRLAMAQNAARQHAAALAKAAIQKAAK